MTSSALLFLCFVTVWFLGALVFGVHPPVGITKSKLNAIVASSLDSPAKQRGIATRRSFLRLNQPFRRTVQGQRSLSFLGPSLWNQIPEEVKCCKSVNAFKHALKKHYFTIITDSENDIYQH